MSTHARPADGAEVSVIVPCRDAAPFLGELLDSLAAQTVPLREIVIVDDGSTDASVDVAHKWRARHPTQAVVVVSQPTQGVGAAVRRGIAASTSPLVARADADDVLDPRWIEALSSALEAHPEAAYSYPAMRMFGDHSGRYYTREFSAPSLVFEGNFVCCGALMRRSAYEQTSGVADLSAWEDWDLWLSFLDRGLTGVLVDEELYLWRRHGSTRNTMSWLARRWLRLRIWARHWRLVVRYGRDAPRLLISRTRRPVRVQ